MKNNKKNCPRDNIALRTFVLIDSWSTVNRNIALRQLFVPSPPRLVEIFPRFVVARQRYACPAFREDEKHIDGVFI